MKRRTKRDIKAGLVLAVLLGAVALLVRGCDGIDALDGNVDGKFLGINE